MLKIGNDKCSFWPGVLSKSTATPDKAPRALNGF
jgi:hypothetical protein